MISIDGVQEEMIRGGQGSFLSQYYPFDAKFALNEKETEGLILSFTQNTITLRYRFCFTKKF